MKHASPIPEPDPAHRGHTREHRWLRLAPVFRRFLRGPAGGDEQAPFGFSTRVVSEWLARRREQAALMWQRWSFRAAAFSMVLALGAVLAGLPVDRASARGGGEAPILPYPGLDVPLPIDNPSVP